jgi:transcriptional regulator with XRE-family HTH domain
VIDVEQQVFIDRLVKLRMNKGVSARDMSLSIGQSEGYINNIENGVNFPSMTVFFYICDYFGISPMEFFDIDSNNPTKNKELLEATKNLSNDKLEHLIAIAKSMK